MPLLRPVLLALLLAGAAFARPAPVLAQPDVQMCTGQPVPQGYVIVGTANRGNCPSEFGSAYNTLTIRLPGDTVSVCSELSQLSQGWVVTGHAMRGACPTGFGTASNSITYQRVGGGSGRPGGAPVPSGSFAPMDPYDRAAFRRLAEVAAWLRLDTPTHHPWLAKTAAGTTVSTRLQLAGGTRYTLVAVCDEDCGDIDLRVMDNGYRLAEDVSTEAHASAALTPTRNGQVSVEVVMVECAQSPCHFVVGVYETPRPAALPPRRSPGGDVRVTPRPRP